MKITFVMMARTSQRIYKIEDYLCIQLFMAEVMPMYNLMSMNNFYSIHVLLIIDTALEVHSHKILLMFFSLFLCDLSKCSLFIYFNLRNSGLYTCGF